MYYHVDGDLVDREDATVHVDDRGFRYGDAAFETCRAYGGEVFLWDRHRERLAETCRLLGMAEAVPEDLQGRIDETLQANGYADAYIRVSVSRGVQSGKLTPGPATDPTVVVYAKPLPRGGGDGENCWETDATVHTVETRRPPESVLPSAAKTHNYLNGILARIELRGTAADEALMCDTEGAVAEGATSNVFFVEEGTLKTPAKGALLPGITRATVLSLAESEGIPVEEGRYRPADIEAADEAFLTNTTWEVRPIATVDGTTVGGGETTRRLSRAYDELVETRCY
ncbi:aminodeoxychorismate lyase [Natronomonas pharaonis DSM 2160]|uniref:Aminodeoxychorismate lyase n=1 Tax=Natronomonas pharaonis (strain ATCC 35678 / DSM 2160 / CIP 103997 / JCM 8858 / NBRC 14720 / NCIMB 2260 / Gabara) TaxID=348780 RepID=A0A1U7EU78_NATPD|nr:aminotransferase class IV [Natronomonas pharaonis]CAI48490.1 aminodeoxychorismate lyase [Natronomonas pharaonis DSM 2160]